MQIMPSYTRYTSCRLQAASFELQATSYKLQLRSGHELADAGRPRPLCTGRALAYQSHAQCPMAHALQPPLHYPRSAPTGLGLRKLRPRSGSIHSSAKFCGGRSRGSRCTSRFRQDFAKTPCRSRRDSADGKKTDKAHSLSRPRPLKSGAQHAG